MLWFRNFLQARREKAKKKSSARFLELARDWPYDVVERYLDWETLPESRIPEGYPEWSNGYPYAELRDETKAKIARRENSGVIYRQKFPQERRVPKRTNGQS